MCFVNEREYNPHSHIYHLVSTKINSNPLNKDVSILDFSLKTPVWKRPFFTCALVTMAVCLSSSSYIEIAASCAVQLNKNLNIILKTEIGTYLWHSLLSSHGKAESLKARS